MHALAIPWLQMCALICGPAVTEYGSPTSLITDPPIFHPLSVTTRSLRSSCPSRDITPFEQFRAAHDASASGFLDLTQLVEERARFISERVRAGFRAWEWCMNNQGKAPLEQIDIGAVPRALLCPTVQKTPPQSCVRTVLRSTLYIIWCMQTSVMRSGPT